MHKAQELIDKIACALRNLPGIGAKNAKRIAIEILSNKQAAALNLVKELEIGISSVKSCSQCQNISLNSLCEICSQKNRNQNLLCIVKGAQSLIQIESTKCFDGIYFVLPALISAIDNINAKQIGISKLIELIDFKSINEIIYAIPASIEAETTLYHIKSSIDLSKVKISYIAQGVPHGSNFDNLDRATITNAIKWRRSPELLEI